MSVRSRVALGASRSWPPTRLRLRLRRARLCVAVAILPMRTPGTRCFRSGIRASAKCAVSSILRSRLDDATIVVLVDPATDELVRKVAKDVAEEVATEVGNRLEYRMQVHFERMEGLVTRAAEGFDATLGSIDRRLKRLEKKWDTRILDHERILSDHHDRLKTLERRGR